MDGYRYMLVETYDDGDCWLNGDKVVSVSKDAMSGRTKIITDGGIKYEVKESVEIVIDLLEALAQLRL